jgi:hypothetical protein
MKIHGQSKRFLAALILATLLLIIPSVSTTASLPESHCRTIAGPGTTSTACDGKAMTIFTNKVSLPNAELQVHVCATVENNGDCPLTLLIGPDTSITIPPGQSAGGCVTLSNGGTIVVKSTAATGKSCKYTWRVDSLT